MANGRKQKQSRAQLGGTLIRGNCSQTRIIQAGSRIEALQTEEIKIFKKAVLYNIKLEPEWIPREENGKADYTYAG